MKLRLIAEASVRDIPEGLFGGPQERGNNARSDEISREQTAKNLVITTLHKLRNMLEPMGLLKSGSKGEPVHDPNVGRAFNSLRDTVKSIVSRDAKKIIANEEDTDLDSIGKYWGFQIPRGWLDVHSGQAGRATADGYLDDLIRQARKEAAEIPSNEKGLGLKAQILKDLGNDIWKWHQS